MHLRYCYGMKTELDIEKRHDHTYFRQPLLNKNNITINGYVGSAEFANRNSEKETDKIPVLCNGIPRQLMLSHKCRCCRDRIGPRINEITRLCRSVLVYCYLEVNAIIIKAMLSLRASAQIEK